MKYEHTSTKLDSAYPAMPPGMSRAPKLPARVQHHYISGRQQTRMEKAYNYIEAIRTKRITDERSINLIARDYQKEFNQIANEH